METNEDLNLSSEGQTPLVNPGTYSPVTVYNQDSLGALILGILALMLLIGWMRGEESNRQLRLINRKHRLGQVQGLSSQNIYVFSFKSARRVVQRGTYHVHGYKFRKRT